MTDIASFAQARVGTTLRGKYRLEKLLGVGGMAAVYQATHRVGNRVALKVLHPHMSINADVRARFLREGYVANKVGHHGAVKVLDDDTAEDGSVFLAMELCLGEPLDVYWRNHGERLPARQVCELAHELLDVLAAAHDKGIVHRDIKPENLFLTDGGVLKVLDFGIARLAGVASPQGATRTGRMLGSPAFMAPEQALGLQRKIDGQTDVWSAAATMFTLISGAFVHDAETVEMMLVHAGSRPARSLATVAPQVPAPIVGVVDRGLAFEKGQRWASAREMQAALEGAYLEAFGMPIPGARGSRPVLQLRMTVDQEDAPPAAPRASVAPTLDSTHYQEPALSAVSARGWDDEGTERMPAPPRGLTGASTTAGIEPSRAGVVAGPPRARRSTALAVGLGGAITAMAVVAAFVLRGGGSHSAAAGSGPDHTPPATSAAPTVTAPPLASVVVPVLATTEAPPPTPSASTSGGRSSPRVVPAPPPPTAVAPHASAPVSAAPAPAPAPSCRTVLDHYDSNYQPIYRQDCH